MWDLPSMDLDANEKEKWVVNKKCCIKQELWKWRWIQGRWEIPRSETIPKGNDGEAAWERAEPERRRVKGGSEPWGRRRPVRKHRLLMFCTTVEIRITYITNIVSFLYNSGKWYCSIILNFHFHLRSYVFKKLPNNWVHEIMAFS